jgi:hypothetical protein
MRSIMLRSSITALCLVAVAACGPSGPSNTPQRAGGVNIVALSGMIAGMTLASTSVSAGFVEAPAGAAAPCTTRTEGACTITQCMAASADAGAPDPDAGMVNSARSAGVITVSGGGQMVQLTPMANGTYPTDTQRMSVFAPGTELTVSAAGDAMGVAAFTGTVTMPGPIMVTAPTISLTAPTTIARAQPLMVTWTGGTTGKVSVVMASNASGGASVSCTYDATAGSGTVPATALMALPMGDGTIAIGGSSTREQTAGGFNVTLTASSANLVGGAGRATFQ